MPFQTVEATLPEGPHSALTTNLPAKDNYSLCGQNLTIPTTLTGQNATVVNESVKVAVHGCQAVKASKTRKLTRAQRLVLALRACRKRDKHSHAKHASCESRPQGGTVPRTQGANPSGPQPKGARDQRDRAKRHSRRSDRVLVEAVVLRAARAGRYN